MFKEEMGDKPYLQIEVDEHYSKVGVITRIEASLNSISHRSSAELPKNFNILDVSIHPAYVQEKPDPAKKLWLPPLGWYTPYLVDYFQQQGLDAQAMPDFNRETLAIGRAEMNSKEYLPLPMLVGSCLEILQQNEEENVQFLIPYGYGADADGQYARAVRTILDRRGYTKCGITAPILEELSEKASDTALLMRALLTGDVLYHLQTEKRAELAHAGIPSEEALLVLAKQAAAAPSGKTLAVVGSPMCITRLDEGILSALEEEGYSLRWMPLSEMMWFLWKDNGKAADGQLMEQVHQALGKNSTFSAQPDALFQTAKEHLGAFTGNHGRYRFAKAAELGEQVDGILAMAPRYENSAMVLQLCGISSACAAPLFEVSLDGD